VRGFYLESCSYKKKREKKGSQKGKRVNKDKKGKDNKKRFLTVGDRQRRKEGRWGRGALGET